MDYIHTLRPIIGHRKIILNAASVIIQRDGKVLLQRRSDNGEWGLIGGLLEINETYEEAALREVREETGLEVKLDSFLWIFHNHNMVWSNGDQAHVITAFFTASIISGDPRIDEESLELRFFGLEEMPPLFAEDHRENDDQPSWNFSIGKGDEMPNEAELRLHRCCFTGHRPEKLNEPPEEVQAWLEAQIDRAISDGYTTFISGYAMGVDIWTGEIVLRKKAANPEIHLIAATPWPGFSNRWSDEWRRQYSELLRCADLVINVCTHYHNGVFQQRNEWIVDHSNRVIAFFNGAHGGTKNTIDYAENRGIEVITNNPDYQNHSKREPKAKEEPPPDLLFPENIVTDIGLAGIFSEDKYTELSLDQVTGLEYIIGILPRKEKELLELRYKERLTFQECGERFGFSRQRAQQVA